MIISVKGVNKKERNTDDENKNRNMGYAYMTDKLSKWQQGTPSAGIRMGKKSGKHLQMPVAGKAIIILKGLLVFTMPRKPE